MNFKTLVVKETKVSNFSTFAADFKFQPFPVLTGF